MTRLASVVFAAIALAGCVAVWGRAYDIDAADSGAVAIKYDAHFTSAGNVLQVAQASCERYDKVAISREESTSLWGITTARFDCIGRQQ
jgi:hypothetical protein